MKFCHTWQWGLKTSIVRMPGQQKPFCSLYCHIKHRNHTADSKSQMMEGLSSQGPVPTKALPNCPLPQEENLTPFETRVHRGWKPVTVEPNSCLIHIGIPAGCVTGGVYCTVGDELSRVLLLLSPPLLSSPLPGLTQCLRAFLAVVLWLFEPSSLFGGGAMIVFLIGKQPPPSSLRVSVCFLCLFINSLVHQISAYPVPDRC